MTDRLQMEDIRQAKVLYYCWHRLSFSYERPFEPYVEQLACKILEYIDTTDKDLLCILAELATGPRIEVLAHLISALETGCIWASPPDKALDVNADAWIPIRALAAKFLLDGFLKHEVDLWTCFSDVEEIQRSGVPGLELLYDAVRRRPRDDWGLDVYPTKEEVEERLRRAAPAIAGLFDGLVQ